MDDAAAVTKSKSILAQSRRVVSDIAVDDGEMRVFSVAGNTVRFRWRESPQLFDAGKTAAFRQRAFPVNADTVSVK
jgi:hypothetical protein